MRKLLVVAALFGMSTIVAGCGEETKTTPAKPAGTASGPGAVSPGPKEGAQPAEEKKADGEKTEGDKADGDKPDADKADGEKTE